MNIVPVQPVETPVFFKAGLVGKLAKVTLDKNEQKDEDHEMTPRADSDEEGSDNMSTGSSGGNMSRSASGSPLAVQFKDGDCKQDMPNTLQEVTFYNTTEVSAAQLTQLVDAAVRAAAAVVETQPANFVTALEDILRCPEVEAMLLRICRVKIFSVALHKEFNQSNLELLGTLKKLKYWYVLPQSTFLNLLATAAKALNIPSTGLRNYAEAALNFRPSDAIGKPCPRVREICRKQGMTAYLQNEMELEKAEPHAVYPTSTYRDCDGHVLATSDDSLIESVMSTTLTTTIKIQAGILDPANPTLRNMYAPLGRCVMVIDSRVDGLYGERLSKYFATHNIELTKLSFRAMEADKGLETVEKILTQLKKNAVGRNEPILIVGGGVMADLGGFAAALYHRNTPYVMLCTSIVSGIDAGPSPRTCCDADGYKNLFGAYHPPALTLTDRTLFGTLHAGWLRHGIAEIIKMAVVKDSSLFDLLEECGSKLITTRFGAKTPEDKAFNKKCDLIVGKAMHSYVQSEYGNLWETHQCRPHAYGHTWSPGYEIPAGMLHGHAVATGMGWGAYLAMKKNFINEQQMHRILRLISAMELSLYHPIMMNAERVFATQKKIIDKRGGHLCAPVPKGEIGKCGYIQDLTLEEIRQTLKEYKQVCAAYPRGGLGIDAHCADVGLEDPATVGERKDTVKISALEKKNAELEAKLAKAMAMLKECGCEECEDGSIKHTIESAKKCLRIPDADAAQDEIIIGEKSQEMNAPARKDSKSKMARAMLKFGMPR